MADTTAGLTTEQLLVELGRVVMGIGVKIDSLGEKLDAIHTVLSEEKSREPEGSAVSADLTPLLDKLDAIHGVLSAEKPAAEGAPTEDGVTATMIDMQPVLDKLEAIHVVLSAEKQLTEGAAAAEPVSPAAIDMQPVLDKLDELKDALREVKTTGSDPGEESPAEKFDIAPMLEKFDEVKVIMESMKLFEEFKPVLEALTSSVEKMPATMMESVEKKLDAVYEKLGEIHKAADNREFVETITCSVDLVKGAVEASGTDVATAVKEIPGKLDGIAEDISGSMVDLKEKTGEVLDIAKDTLEKSEETLENIKDELQKGLKLNTDMTGQMVDLTSKFADRAQEDRIVDLNSRAVAHYNRGEYAEAGAIFKEAITLSPGNSELLCNYAHVLSAQDDLKGAEELFRKALGESPELEPALSGLGMIMVKTGRAEETIEFLKSTILSGTPGVRTTIAYARALADVERHDESVQLLETCLKGAPDNPEIKDELARYGYQES